MSLCLRLRTIGWWTLDGKSALLVRPPMRTIQHSSKKGVIMKKLSRYFTLLQLGHFWCKTITLTSSDPHLFSFLKLVHTQWWANLVVSVSLVVDKSQHPRHNSLQPRKARYFVTQWRFNAGNQSRRRIFNVLLWTDWCFNNSWFCLSSFLLFQEPLQALPPHIVL